MRVEADLLAPDLARADSMQPAHIPNDGGDLMYSGVINKTSTNVDVLEVLSGTWNQYTSGEWTVIKTPFYVVITAILDKGSHVMPFTVNVPIAGTLTTDGGDVKGVIYRPGNNVIDVTDPGIVQFSVFGDQAKLTAVR